MILCSDKSSERNLSCFFDMRKPMKMEHLHKEEPFSSDPYFSKLSSSSEVTLMYSTDVVSEHSPRI